MGENHGSGRQSGMLIRATLAAAGSGREAQQRQKLVHKIADALRDSGFVCDLIIPGEDEGPAPGGR
jgi:hypothetical protein